MTITEQRLHVWAAFIHAHEAVVSAIEDELRRDHELALTAYEVLMRLGAAPEMRMRMHDLAGLALLSKSGLTRLVDRLEGAGYVVRKACSEDRRVTYAMLTEAGHQALEDARPLVHAAIDRHFDGLLTAKERDALLSACRKILHAHGRVAGLDACGGC